MKIILLEDIKTLGKKGDVAEVADGYGRSLIKKKQAKEGTKQNLNDLKLQKKNDEKIEEGKLQEAIALGDSLRGKSITIPMKAGGDGKTFGSVSTKEIAEEIEKQLGAKVDKKKITVNEAVKSLGTYEVKIKLHRQVTTAINLKVVEMS